MSVAERATEKVLFASRWLMAPFYLGLVGVLVVLLAVFVRELIEVVPSALTLSSDEVIVTMLTMVDLSLAANLLLIVIFSGYENFVSRIDTRDADRPEWMGTIDFSGLKLKLIASIVAISAIDLLKSYLDIGGGGEDALTSTELGFKMAVHLTFVTSGLMLAVMDWVSYKADPAAKAAREKSAEIVGPGSGPNSP